MASLEREACKVLGKDVDARREGWSADQHRSLESRKRDEEGGFCRGWREVTGSGIDFPSVFGVSVADWRVREKTAFCFFRRVEGASQRDRPSLRLAVVKFSFQ